MNTAIFQNARTDVYSFLASIFLQEPNEQTLHKQLRLLQIELKYPLADRTMMEKIKQEFFDCFFVPVSASYTPPYESALLNYDEKRQFGYLTGPATQEVLAFYQGVQFDPLELSVFEPLKEVSLPDHVGFELAYMAYLCQQEDAAQKRGAASAATMWAVWQKEFLSQHLARWLPKLAKALADRQAEFYATAAEFAASWVNADLGELSEVFEKECSHGQ